MVSKEQRIFNSVILHLYNQQYKALAPNGNCVYRAKNGRQCAIGSLIPDGCYSPNIEGFNPVVAMSRNKGVKALFADVDHDLLIDLQYLHDRTATLKDGKINMWVLKSNAEKLAREYGLSTEVFSEYTSPLASEELKWSIVKPPHIGWWLVTQYGLDSSQAWRWWDGKQWSVMFDESERIPAKPAESFFNDYLWSTYWPKDARVPRINPGVPQWQA